MPLKILKSILGSKPDAKRLIFALYFAEYLLKRFNAIIKSEEQETLFRVCLLMTCFQCQIATIASLTWSMESHLHNSLLEF